MTSARLAALALALIAAFASPAARAETGPRVPRPVAPIGDATVLQNDLSLGCPPHRDRGAGFGIRFEWTEPAAAAGVSGYDVVAERRGATAPIVERATTTPWLHVKQCNVFIIDANLDGWQWRVRARDRRGRAGEWSPLATFRFAPCRFADGRPCNARP